MSKNIKKVTVKIEKERWDKALDDAFNKANENIKIDGFRKGKAPKDVYLKKYGEQSLYSSASEVLMQEAYTEVLENNKELEIVASPNVSITKMDTDGIEFEFELTLLPTVKLGKYKGLNVQKEAIEVTEEEIDAALEQTLATYSEEVLKEDEIKNGDIAVINFEGFLNGVPFEGGQSEKHPLKIGSNSFIPGFEEQLIGLKSGDKKDIEVVFPEDYHSEDLKGKPVIFKVEIVEVKEIVKPEFNEEFFEDLGLEGINDELSLREQLKENLEARKDMETENKYIDSLLEECAKTVEVDIPEIMVKEETDRMIAQFAETLKRQQLELETYYQLTNLKEEDLREQMKGEATNRIKYRLMLEEIAKIENIEITDSEANEEMKKISKNYNMEEEELLNMFGGIEMIKYDLKMRRAIELLKKDE